jgi:predicted GNAT superfamily acetyltransferase
MEAGANLRSSTAALTLPPDVLQRDRPLRDMTSGVQIEPATDPGSCRAIEDVQREVWGLPERGIVPAEQIRAIVHNGGMLLIARAGDELVGFCYAFVGAEDDRPIWCSHMLAVRPAWRSRGIGQALKLAQRRLARERGIDKITWTFDPLQTRNAYLNLHRLGARARRYFVNHYGEMDDDINRGMPTDRLLAEWSVHGKPPPSTAGRQWLLTADTSGDLPRPGDVPDKIPHAGGLVAVPSDIEPLRSKDPHLLAQWRMALRSAFREAFAAGLVAVDLERDAGDGVSAYVLGRTS